VLPSDEAVNPVLGGRQGTISAVTASTAALPTCPGGVARAVAGEVPAPGLGPDLLTADVTSLGCHCALGAAPYRGAPPGSGCYQWCASQMSTVCGFLARSDFFGQVS